MQFLLPHIVDRNTSSDLSDPSNIDKYDLLQMSFILVAVVVDSPKTSFGFHLNLGLELWHMKDKLM